MSFEQAGSSERVPVTYGYEDGRAPDVSPFDEDTKDYTRAVALNAGGDNFLILPASRNLHALDDVYRRELGEQ